MEPKLQRLPAKPLEAFIYLVAGKGFGFIATTKFQNARLALVFKINNFSCTTLLDNLSIENYRAVSRLPPCPITQLYCIITRLLFYFKL